MNQTTPEGGSLAAIVTLQGADREQMIHEFQRVRQYWCWLFSFGVLLVLGGTVAVVVPAATAATSVVAMIVLGTTLIVCGVATIVAAIWTGKWTGLMPQLLCGVLYLVSGYIISDEPLRSAAMMAAFIAAMFVILGAFRIIVALLVRFPHWGWALLNGFITLMCGVVIFRHFASSAIWVVGLLVGLEMLFHGWTWIMLSMAIKNIPKEAT